MKNKLILACLLALSTLTSIGQTIYINEVDADQAGTDTGEFVELYGTPNTSLNGYTLVLFNGNDDLSYAAYGLDGYSLDENGFFVLGNSAVPNMDMLLPANGLQNGADAVALYEGSADDFPNDSPLTSDDLLDYMVYDTDDEDDEVLLALLMAGGQLNENELGNGDTHSNSRMPDGGTVLSTEEYVQQTPTPGESNVLLCDAGVLTNDEMEDFVVCVEDAEASTIVFGNTSNTEEATYIYVVTDLFGAIQFISEGNEIDFLDEAIGESLVWGVSYDGTLDESTTAPGVNIANLVLESGDCISKTEEGVYVLKENCSAPDCDSGIVLANGEPNVFMCLTDEDFEVTFTNDSSTPEFDYAYVITDLDGNILVLQSSDSYDFEGMGPGGWNIYGISYIGELDETTTEVGDPVSGIVAETCISMSQDAIVTIANCADGCSNLFFSEYIEGSSSNKALEIYNPMDLPADLSEYTVNLYPNGATDPGNTLTLSGTLAPGEVYVIANASATTEILDLADITATVTFYNGDDAVELVHNGVTIDVIGQIGEDPGTSWPVGSGSTKEYTLIRMITINEGTSDWAEGAMQWDVYEQDEFGYLGYHVANACGSSDFPTISFTTFSQSVEEGTEVTIEVSITNSVYAVEATVSVEGGTASLGADYEDIFPEDVEFEEGATEPYTFTFLTTDDLDEEEDESIELSLTAITENVNIGTGSQTITIEDNDAVIEVMEVADVVVINQNGEAESLGEVVEVRGVVYGVNLRPDGLQFTLIDPTDGIGIFSLDDDLGYTVNEGDSIHVVGEVDQFNGLTQIAAESVTYVSSDNPLKVPAVVTALNEITESDLIQLNCVHVVEPEAWLPMGSGFNVDVTDGVNTYSMRIDNDVELFDMEAPQGSFTLVGIGAQFDSSSPYTDGYQILPRYAADVMPSFDMGYTVTGEDIGEINIDDGDCLITGALLSQGYTFTPNKSAADTYIWQLGDLISGNEITFFSDVEMSEVLNLQFGTWEFEFSLTIETDGCFSTITDTLCIDVAGSIGELAEIELDIFPNPASSEVSVNSNEQIEAIHVLNAQGQLIAVDQPRRKNKLLSVEDLAPGLYFVTVQTASGRITRELMLE